VARFLLVASTGEKGKSLLGLRWAIAAIERGWAEEVRVVLFGPVEEHVARGDPDYLEALERLRGLGVEPVLCERYAQAAGVLEELRGRGLTLGPVGEMIAELAGKGYTPLVF